MAVLNGFSESSVSYSKSIFISLNPLTRLEMSDSLEYLIFLKTSCIWFWFSASVWLEKFWSDNSNFNIFVPSPDATLKLVELLSKLNLSCCLDKFITSLFDEVELISIVNDLILLSGSNIMSLLS